MEWTRGAGGWIWRPAAALVVCLAALLAATPARAAFAVSGGPLRADDAAAFPYAIGSGFGQTVALSSDGSTAVVGDPSAGGGGAGAAWIFVRTPAGWVQAQPRLVPTGESGPGAFGSAIAVSGDGGTIAIGAANDGAAPTGGGGTGAVWIFQRSGSLWVQQGRALIPTDESPAAAGAAFGSTLALSSDGSTLLAGAPGDSCANCGAAWVFTRSGSAWAQHGGRLAPRDEVSSAPSGSALAAPGAFGSSVALNGNGTVAAIGDPGDSCVAGGSAGAACLSTGAAWIYSLSGTSASELTKLPAPTKPSGTRSTRWGESVALSGDGATLLVGAGAGLAQPYTRTSTKWAAQGAPLAAPGAVAVAQLDSDGNVALLGTGTGGVQAYVRASGVWGPDGTAFAPGASGGVSLSGDGSTALAGDPAGMTAQLYTGTAPAPPTARPPAPTAAPPSVTGALKGLAGGRPVLTFTVTAGDKLAAITSLTITLPAGLTIGSPAAGVKVAGAHTVRRAGRRLTITLKRGRATVQIRLAGPALSESAALHRRARRQRTVRLKARLTLVGKGGVKATAPASLAGP